MADEQATIPNAAGWVADEQQTFATFLEAGSAFRRGPVWGADFSSYPHNAEGAGDLPGTFFIMKALISLREGSTLMTFPPPKSLTS